MSLIKLCRKLRVQGPLVKWSALERKPCLCARALLTFSEQFSVSILATCAVWGARPQTKVAQILRMVSFHLLAGIHPTTLVNCHPPLLRVLYPISESFCLPPTTWGGRRRLIGSLSSSITSGWVTSLQSKHESLPPHGWSVGRGMRVLKNHFGARPTETPEASSP